MWGGERISSPRGRFTAVALRSVVALLAALWRWVTALNVLLLVLTLLVLIVV